MLIEAPHVVRFAPIVVRCRTCDAATVRRKDYGPGDDLALEILREGFVVAGHHATYERPPDAYNFWWRFVHLTLPYGHYTEADGSIVLFNRRYQPLWRIKPSGEHELASGSVDHVRQGWFFYHGNPPWRDKAMIAMSKRLFDKNGITADAVPIYEALIAEITKTIHATDETRRGQARVQ